MLIVLALEDGLCVLKTWDQKIIYVIENRKWRDRKGMVLYMETAQLFPMAW